jgi:hypothetical protein
MIAILRAAPGTPSRAGYTIELAQPPRNCSAARSVGPLVFDVLDERAQFGQDLTSARVV